MNDQAQLAAGSNLPPKLANPARRALLGAGYTRLEQLAHLDEHALLQLHGIGPNAIRQIRQALEESGLSLAGEEPPQGVA